MVQRRSCFNWRDNKYVPATCCHQNVLKIFGARKLTQYFQLDKLGIQHGRIPKELPFTMSVGYDNAPQQENSEEVERKPMSKDLLEAVSTDEAFDTLYMVCFNHHGIRYYWCSHSQITWRTTFLLVPIRMYLQGPSKDTTAVAATAPRSCCMEMSPHFNSKLKKL